jgi:hypothetical protein
LKYLNLKIKFKKCNQITEIYTILMPEEGQATSLAQPPKINQTSKAEELNMKDKNKPF